MGSEMCIRDSYQGAATGVGGIIRDIFTMGARPIALLNALRFGSLDTPLARRIFEGVVAGVGGYGNSIGIPTVGGEIGFDESYTGNPLVNVFCLGIAPADEIIRARASSCAGWWRGSATTETASACRRSAARCRSIRVTTTTSS